MSGPLVSVVIPAHDDEAHIEATLHALLADAAPGEFEVVVVCNGCTDDTAGRARRVPGVTVVELERAGKSLALQAGDEHARTFPRIYLDSDTRLATEGARALAAALRDPGARVAGMRADFEHGRSSRFTRWYLDFRNQLPVFSGGIIGAGVYAMDETGRGRFERWPNVLGDDQFVLRSFAPHERRFVAAHRTVTPAPHDLRAIVRRGARVRRGNRELLRLTGLPPPPSGARSAVRAAMRRPGRWPGMATWLLVGVASRVQDRLGARGDWQRPRETERTVEAGTPSVIVLTYNSATSLADCLASLEPQVAALGGELLVVDNASTDDTVEVARAWGYEVHQTGGNLGFAAGCNVGGGLASGDVLVFVNPDAAVDDGAIAGLLAAADPVARMGPAGGRGRRDDGSYDPNCILGRPSLVGALAFAIGADIVFRSSSLLGVEHGPPFVPPTGGTRPVTAVSGALMALPRPLWERLGGFDEGFFLYGEDVDLCLRAAALGWQPVMVPTAGYRHQKAVSSGGSPLRDVLLYRGKAELYRRHLSPAAARLAIVALQVGTGLRGCLGLLPVERVRRRAAPWWSLFRRRREWRRGYVGFQRPGAGD